MDSAGDGAPSPRGGQGLLSLRVDLPPGAAVCVALSGGLDSVVLLDRMHADALATGRSVSAVHVHHGLSPNADAWACFCADICARRGLALDIIRVAVDRASNHGLEGAARKARYAVFAKRPEPFVALAHHLDDQAETVLLQMLRGTGVKGAAAMPRTRALTDRVTLFRPLLDFSRADLLAHAQACGLQWIEDESNARTAHDRNFVRHDVGPVLATRFPHWPRALARFARHAAEADALLEELAKLDGAPPAAGEALRIDGRLSHARRANVLRAFLARNGLAMPSEARLAEISAQLYEARRDATVRLEHDGIAIVRHRGEARLEAIGQPAAAWRVEWEGEPDVVLGDERGAVHFERTVGSGLTRERSMEGAWFFASRRGGERMRLSESQPTRTLKNLLQEHALSLAERALLPLLFHGDRLVWAPGIGIAAEYACRPGEAGLLPHWNGGGKSLPVLK